jgi:phosphoglycolate phosphatase
MIRAIIFDSDGTLFNSSELGKITLLDLCKKNNLVFDEKKYYLYTGFTRKDKFLGLFPNEFDKLWPVWDKAYTEKYEEFARIFPEVMDTIKSLKEKGILLFIFSTKKAYLIKQALDKFDLSDYFLEVIGGEFDPIKPDPKAIENILKKYDLKKEELFLVGDSKVDLDSAKNANINFVLVDHKKKSKITTYYKKINYFSEINDLLN